MLQEGQVKITPFSVRPRRLFTFVSSPLLPTTARHLSLCVALYTHTRCAHISTETYGGFCPVIWHIFDVEKKKKKRQNERTSRERREREQSRLSTPVKGTLCWAPPRTHTLTQPSLHFHPSTPPLSPLQSLGGFFIKCYQKCDWSYSWADGGLAVRLETNAFTGEWQESGL